MSSLNNILINSELAVVYSDEVSNDLGRHFKMIQSNIQGTLSMQMAQAQVILIGESHHRDEEAKLYTGLVARSLGNKDCHLLVEESKPTAGAGQLRFFSETPVNVSSWDLRNDQIKKVIQIISQIGKFLLAAKTILLIEELFINNLEDLNKFLEYFNELQQIFIRENSDLEDFSGFTEYLHTYSQFINEENFSAEQADQLRQSTLDLLKTVYLDILEEKSESFYQGIIETFMQRNVSMLKNITLKITEGKKQIFVLAGKAHVKKSKKDQIFHDAVDLLKTYFEQKKIPYLVIRPKKNPANTNPSQKTAPSSTQITKIIKSWNAASFKMTPDVYLGIQIVREYFQASL